jgi:hypothetical protein
VQPLWWCLLRACDLLGGVGRGLDCSASGKFSLYRSVIDEKDFFSQFLLRLLESIV